MRAMREQLEPVKTPVPDSEKNNPWVHVNAEFGYMGSYGTAYDRLAQVKTATSIDWLERALAWPNTQSTVKCAIEVRLRALRKAGVKGGA